MSTVEISARIRVGEIARRLHVRVSTVRELLERGVIPGVQSGKSWLVLRQPYLAWERTGATARGPQMVA